MLAWFQRFVLANKSNLIAASVLALSGLLAFIANTDLYLLVLVALGGGMGVIYLYRNMQQGLIWLIVASYLVNYTIGTGTNTSINVSIILVAVMGGLLLVDMVLIKKYLYLPPSSTVIPLLWMIAVAILAFINGQLPWFSAADQAPLRAQFGGLMVFIITVLSYLLVLYLVEDTIWLKRMVWVFVGIGILFILTRLTPELVRFGNRNFAYGSTASLFWLWIVVHTASQGLFNHRLSRSMRVFLLLVLAGTLYFSVVVAYDWKSGWLPPIAALMVIFWIGAPRLRPMAVLAGAMILLLNFVDIPGLVTGNEDYSVLTRSEAWKIMFEIIKVNPFLGLGPANYYWYTPLFPILGYAVEFNSHNNFIDIVAQIGVFGLLFFLWFFWKITLIGLRLIKTAPAGFERAYAIGAVGGIAGMLTAGMLGDWLIPFVYNVGLVGFRSSVFGWLFLGGLVALDQITSRDSSPAKPNNSPNTSLAQRGYNDVH